MHITPNIYISNAFFLPKTCQFQKVIREAALRSGVSQGVMKACWDELADTAIQITCYDRNGDIVKRVTSADAGTVEDPEGEGSSTGGNSQSGNDSGDGPINDSGDGPTNEP